MPPRILLADDSVTVQKVVELTFADEGMQVVAVGDGQQAIDRLDTDPPDIVIADVSMPERDGYAVAAHVKQSPSLRHIPVVLMTGAFEQLDEARAREVGCDGVLAKPFEPQMVIALVRQLLGRAGGEGVPSPPGPPQPAVPSMAAATAPASLDDVFDRIDETVGLEAGREPARVAPGDADTLVTTWPGDAAAGEAPSASPPTDPRRTPASPLAEAFSRLLADELGEGVAPPAWVDEPATAVESPGAVPASTAAPALNDALIDEVARRVASRLSQAMVREVVSAEVIAVAERLVREEIARLKAEG